jgi:hypothetical protein
MPLVKITGQGLLAIAFSVALLWACLIGERAMVQRAQMERFRMLRDFQRFQREQRLDPATAPARLHPPRHLFTAG